MTDSAKRSKCQTQSKILIDVEPSLERKRASCKDTVSLVDEVKRELNYSLVKISRFRNTSSMLLFYIVSILAPTLRPTQLRNRPFIHA